jgi:hypothetical protein
MPAQKKTSVSVTVANEITGGREVCILIEMKIGADDTENVSRCMRDLQRATQTFQLHADLEDKSVFSFASTLGPYFYNDQKNVIAIARLCPQDGVDETVLSAKIRTGVNGVGSLLRQSKVYRVRAKIRPVEQVVIPETEGVSPAPVPEPVPVSEEAKA